MDYANDVSNACYKVPRDAGSMPLSPASKDSLVAIALSPQPKRQLEVQLSEVRCSESIEARFEPDSLCCSTSSLSVSVDATPDGENPSCVPQVSDETCDRAAASFMTSLDQYWRTVGSPQAKKPKT
jgi:hypothetical protein